MQRPRGKRIAIATSIVALGALAGAFVVHKDRIIEGWCLRHIDSADRAVSEAAWDRLATVATERAAPHMLAILSDSQRSELTRARALHVLWVLSEKGRMVPLAQSHEMCELEFVRLVVRAANKDAKAVISAGAAEGIEAGNVFFVHRNQRFVCGLRVITVFQALTRVEVLEPLSAPGDQTVVPGDHAIGVVSRRLSPSFSSLSADMLLKEASR